LAQIEIPPTVAADIAELASVAAPPFRIKTLTGVLDGKVIGIGGVGFPDDGTASMASGRPIASYDRGEAKAAAALERTHARRRCGGRARRHSIH
jgi:hypothetical protein